MREAELHLESIFPSEWIAASLRDFGRFRFFSMDTAGQMEGWVLIRYPVWGD